MLIDLIVFEYFNLFVDFYVFFFFFSSRRRHTRWTGDWSSDVCSSDLFRAGNPACLVSAPSSFNKPITGTTVRLTEPFMAGSIDQDILSPVLETTWRQIGRASCRERV